MAPQAAGCLWIAEDGAGKTIIRFKNRDGFFPAEKYGEIYFAGNESGGELSARVLAGWRTSKLEKC
jgi:hypothetical protein